MIDKEEFQKLYDEELNQNKASYRERIGFTGRGLLPITRLNPPKNPRTFLFATVDIETGINEVGSTLGGPFVYGTVYLYNRVFHYTSLDDMLEDIIHPKNNGMIFYAHNGGRYDFLYFIQYLKDNHPDYHIEWVRSGIRIIGFIVEMSYKKSKRRDAKPKMAKIEFRDSMALLNFSLAKLTKSFEPEHGKLTGTIDWEAGETFDVTNPKHITYAENDVLSLYEILDKFFTIIRTNFNLYQRPPWTASSYGRMAWQATLPEDMKLWVLDKNEREFIRETYYGGMVRIHKHHASLSLMPTGFNIYSIDSNSHYPAQMMKGVPYGKHWTTNTYNFGDIGYYHVRVMVPQGSYTIIPKHINHGTAFPTGEFDTYCTSLELEFALKQGCKIIKIYEGIQFQSLIYPFNDFVGICQRLRKEYKGTVIEMVVKLMQNSVYGKFGQREMMEKIIQTTEPNEEMKPMLIEENGEPIHIGNYYLESTHIEDNIFHPEWASWITANGRVALSETAYPFFEKERLIYTDTDSIKFIGREDELITIDIDNFRYGAFKVEKVGREMIVLAPKTYMMEYFDQKTQSWGYDMHAKGLPTKSLNPKMFLDYETSQSMIKGLRGGFAQLKRNKPLVEYMEVTRHITQPSNVLNWIKQGNTFVPIHIIDDIAI